MKAKQVVTGILLFFVVGSVAYMVGRQAGTKTADPQVLIEPETLSIQPETVESHSTIPTRQVIVYYFHGDMRCTTCRKLESYAKEAVEANFAEELGLGLVQWKTVNVDQAENGHFVKDYELVTKAVILSEVINGKETAWRNLDKIWDLVGNKAVYLEYISENLRMFLEEEHS